MIPVAFLTPALLFAAAAIPLLVLAYLRKQQTRRFMVSSVIVLKTLARKPAPRRRFFPPLRFFLELLALACLVLAAAQPMWDTHGDRIAVLLDNSLIMRAAAQPKVPGTRFDAAKQELRSWVGRQSSASRFTLFTAAPRLQQSGGEEVSASALLQQAEALEPGFAPDAIEGAASELLSSDKYDKVFLVTDKSVELEGGTKRVEFRSVGVPLPNLAVTNLKIEKEGIEGKKKLVFGVSYSGEGSGNVPVQLAFLPADGAPETLQSVAVAVRSDEMTEGSFELPAAGSGPGFYRVAVETGKGDALPDDNQAFLASEEGQQTGLLVIDALGENGALGLERIGELAVSSIRPETFTKLTPDELKRYTMLIFHGLTPVQLPEQPMLVVVPPVKNPLFPGKTEVKAPRISSWTSEDPITSYLRVPMLQPSGAVIFQESEVAKAIIRAEEGPVLIAGEGRGVRFAALGFEIFPFEGASTPVPSVLTLNLLSWLRGGTELGAERRTGGSLPFDPKKESLVRVAGSTYTVLPKEGGGVLPLTVPGGYVIRDLARGGNRLLAVNLYHPEESSTGAPQSVVLSAGSEAAAAGSVRGLPLWQPLAWVALVLILLESALALLRRREEAA